MGTRPKTATRHVEEQRRYRARLREAAKVGKDGATAPRGAPETRVVVQALAVAVRALAGRISEERDSVPDATKRLYSRLLEDAYAHLTGQGFDPGESSRRLSLYVLPESRRRRALRKAAEARFWAGSAPAASKTTS